MRGLNWSFRKGCLQCSFSDKDLNDFIQFKRRNSNVVKKKAVEKIGRQQDGTWTLGYGVYISTEGKQLAEAECESVWISHVFQGRGIPDASLSCTINTPLSTESLESFLNLLSKHMKHNFMPALLVMSSSAMVLNYRQFINRLRNCPIPLAFGPSGTGKTTALESGMAILGAHNTRLYSKVTREKFFEMCCESSGLPIAVDDSHSRNDISKLLVDFYNGKKGASIGQGEKIPFSTAIIASNFSPTEQTRYIFMYFC